MEQIVLEGDKDGGAVVQRDAAPIDVFCHECLLDTGVARSGPWIWLVPNLSMGGNQVFTDDDFLSRKPD